MAIMYEAAVFMGILSDNAPQRDEAGTIKEGIYKSGPRKGKKWRKIMPREIRRHGIVISPYPGNLKQNGSVYKGDEAQGVVQHGAPAAVYALYANKRSRKPKYIEKSITAFTNYLTQEEGWELSDEDEE